MEKRIMAELSDIQEQVNKIGDWGVSWRDQAQAEKAAREAAQEAQAAAEAHAQAVVDNDAADDVAQRLVTLDEAKAIADAKLAELQALDTPPVDPPV